MSGRYGTYRLVPPKEVAQSLLCGGFFLVLIYLHMLRSQRWAETHKNGRSLGMSSNINPGSVLMKSYTNGALICANHNFR